MTITLKTFYGLERILTEELIELGYESPVSLNRAVQVKGTWEDVYRLNLHARCAISVLVEIAKFDIRKEDDLYKRCMKIDWTQYFSKDKTFAVKGAVFSEMFKHSQFPFLVVKDAIVDTFRKEFGDRPDVSVKTPQVLFDLYINRNQVTISLNSSGQPLFQRGYRQATGIAPLNEVVAAALIRLSGWDKKSNFVDPFCGSGTLLIEAAFYATGIPSVVERQHFAFKNFANYNAEIWEGLLAEIPKRVTEMPCKIEGSDMNAEMVTKTRRNLRGLPFGRFIDTSVGEFVDQSAPEGGGVMISNPPYGERMGEEIDELYEQLGDWMKQKMAGYDCWVLSSNFGAFKHVGLRPEKKVKVYNGDLECSFRKYSIYEGSKKAKFQDVQNEETPKVEKENPRKERKSRADEPKPDKPKTRLSKTVTSEEKQESNSKYGRYEKSKSEEPTAEPSKNEIPEVNEPKPDRKKFDRSKPKSASEKYGKR